MSNNIVSENAKSENAKIERALDYVSWRILQKNLQSLASQTFTETDDFYLSNLSNQNIINLDKNLKNDSIDCLLFFSNKDSKTFPKIQNRSSISSTVNYSVPKFWFLSLDELIDGWGGEVRKTIYYQPITNTSSVDPNNHYYYMNFSNAMNYEIIHNFDTLENAMRGFFNSRLVSHDITNKTWENTDFNYAKEFPNYKHTDPNPIFSGVIDSQSKVFTDYVESHLMLASTGTYEVPTDLKYISSARINKIQSLNNFRLRLMIPGDGLIQSGDLINFRYPSLEVGGNSVVLDQFYNGKYIVNSIRHIFTGKDYKMVLDCSKESLDNNPRGWTPPNG